MKKNDIRIPLGMEMMNQNPDLKAAVVGDRLGKFFKGCSTIASMADRIKLNGGRAETAKILAATPVRVWRTR